MTTLHIPTLPRLRRLADQHLVTIRPWDNLVVCNYTEHCTFENQWDDDTIACRGLVLRLDRPWPCADSIVEVVALPFPKFFNVGQGGRYPSSQVDTVTEKQDGSLGILFRRDGRYHVATRGTFDSPQAQWATQWLSRYPLDGLPESLTLLFEIIYPENRVIVDHGERHDLVLLGARDRFTGEDHGWPEVQALGERFGFPLPVLYHDIESIEAALERAKTLGLDHEGWVIRLVDGTRWKVKGTRYLEVARLLSHVSRRHVIEAMASGTLDGWVERIPEEFRGEAQDWRAEAIKTINETLDRTNEAFRLAPKGDRKEYALWVKQHCEASDLPVMFTLLDGRDVRPVIYKRLLSGEEAA